MGTVLIVVAILFGVVALCAWPIMLLAGSFGWLISFWQAFGIVVVLGIIGSALGLGARNA